MVRWPRRVAVSGSELGCSEMQWTVGPKARQLQGNQHANAGLTLAVGQGSDWGCTLWSPLLNSVLWTSGKEAAPLRNSRVKLKCSSEIKAVRTYCKTLTTGFPLPLRGKGCNALPSLPLAFASTCWNLLQHGVERQLIAREEASFLAKNPITQ